VPGRALLLKLLNDLPYVTHHINGDESVRFAISEAHFSFHSRWFAIIRGLSFFPTSEFWLLISRLRPLTPTHWLTDSPTSDLLPTS